MVSFLLDTSIVVGFLRGVSAVESYVGLHKDEGLVVSTVTLAELFHGAYKSQHPKRNVSKVSQFIETPEVSVLVVDVAVAREYGKLMSVLEVQGIKLTGADVLIAATAKYYGLTAVTADQKHFSRLTKFGVKVEIV